jgi:hypothetical protein
MVDLVCYSCDIDEMLATGPSGIDNCARVPGYTWH